MSLTLFEVYLTLKNEFGLQNWWPVIRNGRCVYLEEFTQRERSPEEKLEIIIGAILTQNTSWNNAVKAICNIKKKNYLSIEFLNKIDCEKLAGLIKTSGYYNQKAKKIKAFMKFINFYGDDINVLDKYPVEAARRLLLDIWGIGFETADSILLYAYRKLVFVADAYAGRIFSRLGFFDNNSGYEIIRKFFQKSLPEETLVYQEFHALIVEMGKSICRKKPLCEICRFINSCRFAKENTNYAQVCT